MTMMIPRRVFPAVLASCGVILGLNACNRDVRLSGQKIPSFKVATVTHYGQSFDPQASPEQVAYAVLRAIREDYEAGTAEARDQALAVQFDLCAANEIQARNRTRETRDEFIFKTVKRWTPTVAYYVKSFESDWDNARKKLVRKDATPGGSKTGVEECEVLMKVDDPTGDPNAAAILVLWMAKDGGYWRVVHLGFDPTRRSFDGAHAQAVGITPPPKPGSDSNGGS